MRVRLRLQQERLPQRISLSANVAQTALIYHLIGRSDPNFAAWLHRRGYEYSEGSPKRFKLFCYSQLLVPREGRRIVGEQMEISAPQIEWIIASPAEEVLRHLVTGLFDSELRIGVAQFQLVHAETEAAPSWDALGARGAIAFTCLAPLVVSRAEAPGSARTKYLTADDPVGFSEGVRRNLLFKYQTYFGHAPSDDRLELRFDEKYLHRQKTRGKEATRLIRIKDSHLRGVLCPFTLQGSPELIAFGYDAGYGEKNSLGFGLAQVEQESFKN